MADPSSAAGNPMFKNMFGRVGQTPAAESSSAPSSSGSTSSSEKYKVESGFDPSALERGAKVGHLSI